MVPRDFVGRSKTSKPSSESTTPITLTVSSSCTRVVSSLAMRGERGELGLMGTFRGRTGKKPRYRNVDLAQSRIYALMTFLGD